MYVVGGNDGTSSLATTEVYDMETETWTPGPTMSMPRANVACIVLDNRLWAVGGFNGKIFLDSMEYLSADAREWCSYMPTKLVNLEEEEEGVETPTTPSTPVKMATGSFKPPTDQTDCLRANGFSNDVHVSS